MIARFQCLPITVGEDESAFTLNEINPFILALFIPTIGRALMTMRDDPLNAKMGRLNERSDLLIGCGRQDRIKQVHINSSATVDGGAPLDHNTGDAGRLVQVLKGLS